MTSARHGKNMEKTDENCDACDDTIDMITKLTGADIIKSYTDDDTIDMITKLTGADIIKSYTRDITIQTT